VKRGDVYLCDFGDPVGHEPGWRRPALIVSADLTVEYGLPLVAPITRTHKGYPTHVELDGALPLTCYVQCELLRVVSTDRLLRPVGVVEGIEMLRVEQILRRLLVLG
jgi:mRNA interferase MazF